MFPNTDVAIAGKITKFNQEAPFEGMAYAVHQSSGVIKCVYDFAVLGGAVSTISLVDDLGNAAVLPNKALITRAVIDWVTTATSGGSATVALQSKTAADILAATAVASCTGFLDGVPDGTAAHFVKLTADTTIKVVIGTAALTAGKANIFIYYVYSN